MTRREAVARELCRSQGLDPDEYVVCREPVCGGLMIMDVACERWREYLETAAARITQGHAS